MDNTRVVYRQFQRTDLSTYGNAATLPNPFDPAPVFPGIDQLAQSFRRVNNLSLYNDAEVRPGTGIGGGGTAAASFDPSSQPWITDSYRPTRFSKWLSGEPQPAWLNPNIYDLDKRWPAIETGGDFSYRQPPKLDTKPRGFEAWTGMVPAEVFDPVLFPRSQDLRAGRERDKVKLYQDLEDTKWVVPSAVFDPALFPRSRDERAGREPGKVKLYQDFADVQWLIPSVIYDPQFWPAVKAEHFRTPPGKVYRQDTPPDLSWIFTNLPVVSFDPTQLSWVISGDMVPRVKWWTGDQPEISGIVPGAVYDPAFYPSVAIPSTTTAKVNRYRFIDPETSAWIFNNLPTAFDPSALDWFIRGEMVRRGTPYKQDSPSDLSAIFSTLSPIFDPALYVPITQLSAELRRPVLQLFLPTPRTGRPDDGGGFIPSVRDPSINEWAIRGELFRKRAWWTSQQPDMGWIISIPGPPPPPVFDPALFPWGIGYDRLPDRKGLPEVYLSPQRTPSVILDTALLVPIWSLQASGIMVPTWPKRKVNYFLTDPDNASIFGTLPPTFLPETLVHFSDERVRERYKKVPQVEQPVVDWAFTNLTTYNPATQIWAIPDVRMSKRLGRPVWWVYDPDMGWITTNVPPLTLRKLLALMGMGT